MSLNTWDDLSLITQGRLEKWGFPVTPIATRNTEFSKYDVCAATMIYAKIGRRFPDKIPFTLSTVPLIIKNLALDLTISLIQSSQQKQDDAAQEKYDAAMMLLDLIADGTLEVYAENEHGLLSQYDSSYGFSSSGGTYDRAFPGDIQGTPPSTYYEHNARAANENDNIEELG